MGSENELKRNTTELTVLESKRFIESPDAKKKINIQAQIVHTAAADGNKKVTQEIIQT